MHPDKVSLNMKYIRVLRWIVHVILNRSESEKSPKLKMLCPPNSVVMYTSFHKFLEQFCNAGFLADSPFQPMDISIVHGLEG